MRAVLADRPLTAEELTLVDAPAPTAGPGQLLVRVRAAALNHADLLQRRGEFPPPPGETPILGVEIAGDDVASGRPVFGLVGGGAYAEYCAIDEGMAFAIPAGLSYVEAASLPEAYFTADTTLVQLGALARDQRVLIHGGSSGIGTACIQVARHVGARVACTVGTADKAARARALGAELAIEHRREDFAAAARAWTGGAGVDLVVDIIGADYFARNLAALAEGGRLVQIGVMSGSVCTVDLDEILLRRLHVMGTVMRPLSIEQKRAIARRFHDRWLPLIAARVVRPIVDSTFAFAEAGAAHRRLERSEHFGKIVLDLGGGREVVCNSGRSL